MEIPVGNVVVIPLMVDKVSIVDTMLVLINLLHIRGVQVGLMVETIQVVDTKCVAHYKQYSNLYNLQII